jgi:hypothetical protein
MCDRYSLFSTGLSLGVAVPLGDMVTLDIMAGYMRSVWRDKVIMEGEDTILVKFTQDR